MQGFYSQHPRFYHAVDCIIFGFSGGELSLLLLKRKFDPGKGEWSLMGGFVQENECMDDAAKRVLAELTGLTNVFMQQVGTFGQVDRDPGERVVSTAYYALININEYDRQLVEEHNAYWVNINEMPTLLFDHKEMVDRARRFMKIQATMQPISFHLLPEHFTLTQLQMLYEAINGEPVDKRNFRKRVAELGYVEKTKFIDKITSRRGAALYQFNETEYKKSLKFKL
jgi:ADP-ribose pyrophosphatase YjhB (NUDIX family)